MRTKGRSLKQAVRRARSISDLLARDDVRQLLDTFIDKDLLGATALLLVWRDKKGDVDIVSSELDQVEIAGMLEVAKSIILAQDEE